MHAFRRLLVDTTHQLEKESLLDDIMTVDSRRNALDESRVNVVRLEHMLKFLELRVRERPQESIAVVFPAFFFTTYIRTRL